MATRFVRVKITRPDGSSFHSTITAEHAAAAGLKPLTGRKATTPGGAPLPPKFPPTSTRRKKAPTAPAGEPDQTEETA